MSAPPNKDARLLRTAAYVLQRSAFELRTGTNSVSRKRKWFLRRSPANEMSAHVIPGECPIGGGLVPRPPRELAVAEVSPQLCPKIFRHDCCVSPPQRGRV